MIGLVSVAVLASMLTMQPAKADTIPPWVGDAAERIYRDDPNRIVQNFVSSVDWEPFEVEARQRVADLFGVENDARVTSWARSEVRAFLLSRLLDIAREPAGERTSAEQQALARLQTLVKRQRVAVAENAVIKYQAWERNPCTWSPPSVFTYVRPPGNCLFNPGSSPIPPTAEEFAAFAAYDVMAKYVEGTDAKRVMRQMTFGLAFAAALIAAGILAGGAAAIAGGSLLITGWILSVVAPFAIQAAGGGAAFLGATAPALASGAAAGIAGSVVFFLLIAVIGTVFQAINVFSAAEVPVKLQKALDEARAETPDIASAASPGDAGLTVEQKSKRAADLFGLQALFATQTLRSGGDDFDPVASAGSLGGAPAVEPFDPTTDPLWLVAPDSGSSASTSTVTVQAWTDPDQPAFWRWEKVYIHDGWFVRQPFGGAPIYSLSLPYKDADGVNRVAWIQNGGARFIITGGQESNISQVATDCSGQPDCNLATGLRVKPYDPQTRIEGAPATISVPQVAPNAVPVSSRQSSPRNRRRRAAPHGVRRSAGSRGRPDHVPVADRAAGDRDVHRHHRRRRGGHPTALLDL